MFPTNQLGGAAECLMGNPIRVLILEDQPLDAELMVGELQQAGFEVDWTLVDDKPGFLAHLKPEFDLILADFNLPQFDGLQALELLQKSSQRIPFILVSGSLHEEQAVRSLKLGASDFLLKDRLARLGAAVEHALEEHRLREAQKKATDELRESEERFRATFEQAAVGMAHVGMDGHCLQVNRKFCEIVGYSPQELLDRAFQDLTFPDDFQTELELSQKLLSGGIPTYSLEIRYIRKDRATIWITLTKSLMRNPEGQPRYFIAVIEDITKRKDTEETLRLLGSALQQVNNGVVITTPDLEFPGPQIVFVNSAFSKMTGYSEEEVIGKTPRILQGPKSNREMRQRLREQLMEGHPFQGETINYRKDQSEYAVSLHIAPIRNTQGEIAHFVSVQRDVTEHKLAEEALQTSLEDQQRLAGLMSAILNSLPSNIALLDISGTIVAVNEQWKQFAPGNGFLGQDCGIGQNYIQAAESSRDRFFEEGNLVPEGIRAVLAGEKEKFSLEYPCHSPIEKVWFQLIVVPVLDASRGNLLDGAVVMHIDITDRVLAEESVRQAEERYRDLFENANDLIFTYDLEGNFTSINKMGELLTGYSRKETLKMNLNQIIAPEHREIAGKNIEAKLSGKVESTVYNIDMVCHDGHRLPVEVSSRLIYREGQTVGVQGIARDISDRRQLEAQLRQAQKMEAIGRLAGGIAHDFNNWLTVIIGYSQLALTRLNDKERLRHHIEEVWKAGEHASSLTHQLLAFSRKQVMQPRILNLNDLVSDVQKMLKRLIGEDIELAISQAPDLGQIKADPGQIEQVIFNLAVNSRDAMPNGGTLVIQTANVFLDQKTFPKGIEGPPGPFIHLLIRDQGCGMDIETQAHIFEPFFTTKEQGKGTGLGLATVYGIVKQSDGFIFVSSEVGQGTTFDIYFPAVAQTVEKIPKEVLSFGAQQGTETILLVEDDDTVRNLTIEVLASKGYQVLVASNGMEGLQMCEQFLGEINLLVTDVVMPRMSGLELVKRVAPGRPNMRILVISGYTGGSPTDSLSISNTKAYLPKPFTPFDLAEKVRELLDHGLQVAG